jgi:hypothetical protein
VILLLRYQMALVVESGRFKIVLRQRVSHLLLKFTDLGCGTVLTAACVRQGYSASGFVLIGSGLQNSRLNTAVTASVFTFRFQGVCF